MDIYSRFNKTYHVKYYDSCPSFVANQALLATLEEIKFDKNLTHDDREAAAELLCSTLDNEFLFILHFHYDLHECVLGEIIFLSIAIISFQL
jgi:hypothetical protein